MKNKAISFVWNSIEIDPQWNCIKQSQKKANDKLNPIEKTNVLRIESILAQYGKLSEEKSRSNVIFFRLVIVYQSVLLQFQCIFSCLIQKTPFISNGKNDLKKKQRMKTNEKYRISEWIEILLNYFGKKSGRMMWILFYATIKRWAWK